MGPKAEVGRSFTRLMADLTGQPYALGQHDCFTLIVEYLKRRNFSQIPLPDEYDDLGGLNLGNYAEAFEKNPQWVYKNAVRYFSKFLKEKPVYSSIAGDVLVIMLKEGRMPAFAIDGGNSSILTVTVKDGAIILRKTFYEIQKVFGCLLKLA